MQEINLLETLSNLRRKCTQKDNELIERLGITMAEFQLFLASLYVDSLDSSSLANQMGVSVSRISRLIDKLVQNEYLNRVHSETDRRSLVLSFTSKGNALIEEIKKHRAECEMRIKSELSPELQEKLRENLQYLIEKM